MDKVFIKTNKLSKLYPQAAGNVTALRSINLEVFHNDFLAIEGPSGSGKTTLLNIFGMLDVPSKGEMSIGGISFKEIKNKPQFRLENIGFIFQRHHLLPMLTTLENTMIPLQYNLRNYEQKKQNALAILKMLGLEKCAYYNIEKLSLGERQRAAVARALIRAPKLILADEPTGSLDQKNGETVLNILQKLYKESKVTIVMVTHDAYVARYASRIVRLADGAIVSGG